jgi:hypothetical protein
LLLRLIGPEIQINYGTEKRVSDETIEDAAEPLRIQCLPGGLVEVGSRRPE